MCGCFARFTGRLRQALLDVKKAQQNEVVAGAKENDAVKQDFVTAGHGVTGGSGSGIQCVGFTSAELRLPHPPHGRQ